MLTNTTACGIIIAEVKSMEFMTTKEAVEKWNISERRIRQLLQDGRIEGAIKVGNNWNIPINANKPADKRSVKLDNTEFKLDLPDNYFDKVDEFQQIERSVNLDEYREYKQLLSILPFIEYNEVPKLIKILEKQVLYFDLNKELEGILGMVIANINLLNGVSEKKQLATIIDRHINDIVNNTIDLHYSNFRVYAELLKMCKSEETEVDFSVEKLETDILKFKYDNQDITKIFDYTDLIVHFFDFFSVKTQNSIIELFSEYEELDQRKISFHKIISIMRAGVFEFPNLQKEVYSYLIDRINTEPPFQKYPDPVKDSLAGLFYLKNNGCFKETSISTIIQGIKKDIKGIFLVVDWKWFNVRSDDVIEKLLENRTSGDIKKYFATTDEDKEYVDNFIIRMCDVGKLSFNKK